MCGEAGVIRAYCRVSTIEQAADGKSSLHRQEEVIRSIAGLRREPASGVVVYSDPGVSGSVPLRDRPAGAKLLAEIEPGDVIVAAKLDRLFRSASDALAMIERFARQQVGVILIDIGVEPVNESLTGKLFFTVLAALAEFERGRIAERIREGKRGKRARGGYIGGKTPTGHRLAGEGKDAVLVPIWSEQSGIELARSLAPTRSLRAVAEELERQGFVSRNGTRYGAEQIKRMLTTEFYVKP
ncbi:MAG: hypothetical protein C5B50_00700 [Verrucomicrobia bacterium]|nr:MAG: hypothetical protein C5B50_00700 [Verrucomicrobiota bacterium]